MKRPFLLKTIHFNSLWFYSCRSFDAPSHKWPNGLRWICVINTAIKCAFWIRPINISQTNFYFFILSMLPFPDDFGRSNKWKYSWNLVLCWFKQCKGLVHWFENIPLNSFQKNYFLKINLGRFSFHVIASKLFVEVIWYWFIVRYW